MYLLNEQFLHKIITTKRRYLSQISTTIPTLPPSFRHAKSQMRYSNKNVQHEIYFFCGFHTAVSGYDDDVLSCIC